MARSLSLRRFTAAVRRLVPEIERADLAPAPAGVRAQAVRADGELVDDFAFRSVGRALHVLNAPSPAATASLEIGAAIAARLELDAMLTAQIGSNSFAARSVSSERSHASRSLSVICGHSGALGPSGPRTHGRLAHVRSPTRTDTGMSAPTS